MLFKRAHALEAHALEAHALEVHALEAHALEAHALEAHALEEELLASLCHHFACRTTSAACAACLDTGASLLTQLFCYVYL